MREYLADVERTWEDLVLHATDYRAIPGAVVVMGHVEGRYQGEPIKRTATGPGRSGTARRPRSRSRMSPRALTPRGV